MKGIRIRILQNERDPDPQHYKIETGFNLEDVELGVLEQLGKDGEDIAAQHGVSLAVVTGHYVP